MTYPLAERSSTLIALIATMSLLMSFWARTPVMPLAMTFPSENSLDVDLAAAPETLVPSQPEPPEDLPTVSEQQPEPPPVDPPIIPDMASESVVLPKPPASVLPARHEPVKPRLQEARLPPAVQQTPSASAASTGAAAFRSCLAAAPYPSSKEARMQKPAGAVGLEISGGIVSITSSSGSSILDQAARARASLCAESAQGARLIGIVNYIPR